MNWLAHILISENNIDYQLGNFLADPLKCKSWSGANEKLEEGMRMHKSIDIFSDTHDSVSMSKSRLGAKGYLKGIIIDITYDYLLTKNWHLYSVKSLNGFIEDFYARALVAATEYPAEPQKLVTKLVNSKILNSYGTYSGLETAFSRIDKRVSPRVLRKETASGYFPIVKREISGIEKDFLQFFPDLVQHFKSNAKLAENHEWLK